MRHFLISLVSLLSLSAHAADVVLPVCDVPVRFVSQPMAEPVVDHSRSLARLARIAEAEGAARGIRLGHMAVDAQISIKPRSDCQGHDENSALQYAADQYNRLYARQEQFDSSVEYAKNLTVCDGEIAQMLRSRARD